MVSDWIVSASQAMTGLGRANLDKSLFSGVCARSRWISTAIFFIYPASPRGGQIEAKLRRSPTDAT